MGILGAQCPLFFVCCTIHVLLSVAAEFLIVLFFFSVLCAEHVPTACARVDALRSHGYTAEALRLAIAIVRTLKQEQLQSQQRWEEQQARSLLNCTGSAVARNAVQVPSATEGWIGHPLDPIGCLFDTLAEASLVADDQNRSQYYYGKPTIATKFGSTRRIMSQIFCSSFVWLWLQTPLD